MEIKKYADIDIGIDNYERFKNDYEKHFHLNVIRQFPKTTLKEYLIVIFRQCFIDLSKFYEIRNNFIENGERFSINFEEVSKIIFEKSRIGMFVEERIKIEDGKLIAQEQVIEKFTEKNIIPSKLIDKNKIQIKGSLQSIGYLFSELIEKGFIVAPKRTGKNNTSAISRIILAHFEFIDKEEQPKPEDIRKTLFTENKLSTDKQSLFKIPESKIINTD